MAKLIPLAGMVFGRLTVVERSPERRTDKVGTAYWDCNCSCGNFYLHVRGDSIRKGSTASCGCLRKELAKQRIGGNAKGRPHNYPTTRKSCRKES